MSTITTGVNPKAMWPGVKHWFGKDYEEYSPQWPDLFQQETSDKNYEEVVESVGFGLAVVEPQGGSTQYDADQQGATFRFTHVAYSLGFVVTIEEMRDNQYADGAKRRAPDLAFSMRQTKENVAANVYNRGFNSSYVTGDGKELLATDHPSMVGSQSNELAVSADLSEASLEDLVIQINQSQDSRGRVCNIKAQTLHIPPQLEFEAYRILKSVQQNDTANNAINSLRASGAIPGGCKVNQFFTDPDAFFIRTDRRWSLLHFQRDPNEFREDGDFDTYNQKYAAYERYSVGSADFRGIYGSPGA